MKSRYIFAVSILLVIGGFYAAGRNGSQAQQLVNNIATLDQAGQPTEQALVSLADFSHRHMGASASVFLSGAYGRAQAAANSTGATGQVYHDAQVACVSHTSAVNQANCVQQYVASHAAPGSASIQSAQIDASKFTYHYASPRWYPDLAGILLAFGLLGIIAALIRKIRN